MQKIVVGVDGSDESRRALEWAASEARNHAGRLIVITAWETPVLVDGSGFWEGAEHSEEFRIDAEKVATSMAQDVCDGLEHDTRAVEGPAARVLVDEASDADMLVVGSRGRGGFSSLLLGSVSSQCAHHARCPVVIVPDRP
ncbi:MAG: universal stress protein [Acidimicrobiia bacterium]